MPVSSFFGNVKRFAGQALGEAQRNYGQIDKALGGWFPGGAASPISNRRKQIQDTVKEAALSGAGSAMNVLPDRVNLFARYMTGVGNRNLNLDSSTLQDLRMAASTTPTAPQKFTFVDMLSNKEVQGTEQVPTQGPGFPASGAVYPYGYTKQGPKYPSSVTNTLGRFTANVNPEKKTVQIQDRYDMLNTAEDPDLVSGKIQPQKAWNEIEGIWNPAAATRNIPVKHPMALPDREYSPENVKQGLTATGKSATHSPATRFARALMYLTPIKPEGYDVDIEVPLTGEIK